MRKALLFQWLIPIAACCFFACSCGVRDELTKQAQQQGTSKLQQDWKLQTEKYIQAAKADKYSPKGGFYFHEVRILQDLLKNAPRNELNAELQRICAADVIRECSNDHDLDGNYDAVLLQSFIGRSVERRDARQLVALLSHHCPRYIGYGPLEYYLASEWPDSFETLFDCYVAAKSPAARQDIVFCLRRAFPLVSERFPPDHEFVKQAKGWYLENRSKLAVNTRYQYLPAHPPSLREEDRTNLFVYWSK